MISRQILKFYFLKVFIFGFSVQSPKTSGPKTPIEIRRAGKAAYRDSNKLQLLLEQWTAAEGQWQHSDFYIQLKTKHRNRKFGCRKWLTRSEMLTKYGSATIVDDIIAAKMSDDAVKAQQVRAHPDLHGKETEDRPSTID